MAFSDHPLRGVEVVAVGLVRWRVFEVCGVLAVIGLMALGSPASAITWGTIDTTHPNVGASSSFDRTEAWESSVPAPSSPHASF